MRLKLGLAVATMSVASVMTFGMPATASPDPSTTAPEESTTTSEPVEDTTTTTPPSSVPEEPTTTSPGAIGGGIGAGSGAHVGAPERGETQVQLKAPPIVTTTTTQPPPPPYPANSGTGRRAIYSKSLQTVWVVNAAGALIKEHRVSGKLNWCDPRPGTYHVFSRSRYTFAIQNPSLIWGYMVRFTKGCRGGNIGFHEIPTDKRTGNKVQSISQLGTPLSGGCVRQALPDAQWMWDWAQVGTKVVVLP